MNVLLIVTDQQTYHSMSCAGNPWLHTPAMDELAARGTRFTRSYCTYPLCSPSRASFMTGKHPHEYGIYGNRGLFWTEDIPRHDLLGFHFAQAGYRCVWAGKDMPPADGSRDFELLCEWGDVKTADHICGFLQEPQQKPFLAVANFVNPHNICEWARGQEPGEGPLGPEPHPGDLPTLPANHAVDAFEPSILASVQRHSDRVLVGRDYSPQQWRRYLWAYYRMTELVDAQILRILRAFDEAGLADNTVVIFMSDHGDGCGSHRWNQKMVFYEEVIRVPFIVVGPGLQAGALDDRLVSTGEDLFPTCCEAAGIEPPNDRRGHSVLGACRGEESAHRRDALFVESSLIDEFNKTADIMRRNAGRSVVTERWKYSVWSWGENREHLVDLWSDPGEMVNLAVSSRYEERLREMRSVLRGWVDETGDRFVVPEIKR